MAGDMKKCPPCSFPDGPRQIHSSNGAQSHVIGVFLVSLNITSKFEADVFVVVQEFPSEKILCQ